jgi:hypothetical protein
MKAPPAPWPNFVPGNVLSRGPGGATAGNFDEGFTDQGVDDIKPGLRMHWPAWITTAEGRRGISPGIPLPQILTFFHSQR